MPDRTDEGTSAYWRKLLKLGDADASAPAKKLKDPYKFLRPSFHFLVESFWNKYFDVSVSGINNLPEGTPYLIASNHSSSLDFPFVFFALPVKHRGKACVMYKSFYDRIFIARFFIKLFIPSFSVDLKKRPWEALSLAAKILKSGNCVFIAPEGTRGAGEEVQPFKVGVGTLAVETGFPVIPVYIDGANKALPRGSFLPRRAKIAVKFGKPLDSKVFAELKKNLPAYDVYKDFTEKLREAIISLKKSD